MRLRTLALGLALCCGLTGFAQAAGKKSPNAVKSQKATVKRLKKQNAKRAKQSNAAKAKKPRKTKKVVVAKNK